MTIEIREPELAALINQRMATGKFETVEEVLLEALRSAPEATPPKSGLAIFDALQRCPSPDLDIEPERPFMPVKEFSW